MSRRFRCVVNGIDLCFGGTCTVDALSGLQGCNCTGTGRTKDNSLYHQESCTLPLDFYLAGATPAEFTTIYAKNEAFYQANLGRIQRVPEPATWAVTLIGFGALGAAQRCSGVAAV